MDIRFCPLCGTPVEARFRFGALRPVCPACAYVHCPNPRVAAVLFVADGGRILLVKRRINPEKGKWALPAGFVERGERPEHAARREMLEETGLEVAVERLLDQDYNDADQVILLVYQARATGGALAPQDDVEDARWFTRDELPELAFNSTRKWVGNWLGAGDRA